MMLKGPAWITTRENGSVSTKIRTVISFRGTKAGAG